MKMPYATASGHDAPLTRVDARVKLMCALALLVMVLTSTGTVFPLTIAVLCTGLCLVMRVPPRLLLLRLLQPLIIAGVVLVLKLSSGHTPVFSVTFFGFTLSAYSEGLREGILIAGRIVGAVSVATLLGFSTRFTDLMTALAWLRMPRGLVDVTLFAWRYLFVLLDDAMVIYHSQKNRLGYAGYRRGLRSFGALTGALVIKAFDTSQTITTAMTQRGYDGQMPLMEQKPFRISEVAASLGVVVALGFLWRGL